MKVKDILKEKGPHVFTVGDELNVSKACEIMVNNNIGSLLVLNEGGKICGIFTERDILKLTHKYPANFGEIIIRDVMTKEVLIAEPEDDIGYVESIMTQNRIRHLPIVQNKVLVGMITIGDVVKSLLQESRADNKYLFDYISGNVK